MSGYGSALGGRSGPSDPGDAHHLVIDHELRHVVACETEAAAQFVVATLAANGIQAQTHAYFHAFPSVDWVEGYTVDVALEAEAEALRVLTDLSRPDAILLDDPRPGDVSSDEQP